MSGHLPRAPLPEGVAGGRFWIGGGPHPQIVVIRGEEFGKQGMMSQLFATASPYGKSSCRPRKKETGTGRMQNWRGTRRLLVGWIVVCLGLSASSLFGGERSQAFLDGLRDRGFYDVALDYLEAMRNSPTLDKSFQEVLDYETGLTLVQSLPFLSLKEREKRLDEAHRAFRKFMADHPQHQLEASANMHLGNLLIEQGQVKSESARKTDKTPEQKERLLREARAIFQEAKKALTIVDDLLIQQQRRYRNVDNNDAKLVKERDQVRSDILQTRRGLAKTGFYIAGTYEPGSAENKKYLEESAAQFSKYYWKYKRWLGGYVFHIEEARCYKELGNYDKALAILKELTPAQPEDNEGARRIRTTATALALQTYLLPQVKKYQEAWNLYSDWEKKIQRPGEALDQVPMIKYLGGEAALELARSLDKNDRDTARVRKTYLKRARELLTYATRFPGHLRLKAQLKLNDPLLATDRLLVETPKSYEEARDRAKLAWNEMQEADLELKRLDRLRAEALQCFRFALAHAPRDEAVNELNTIRYCLAYLNWVADEYYDAAILGDFLARRYPDRPEGQPGAKIALAAYDKLFNSDSSGENREAERGWMTSMARFIIDRWPNSRVADDAWMVLIRAAVTDRNVGEVKACLEHISVDSPRRGVAELMAGQLLWNAYLEATMLPKKQQPTKAELSGMLSYAKKTLEAGVNRLRKSVDAGGEVSSPLATAVLSLAQICLDMGRGEEAVVWLNDPKIGAHTLTKSKNKVTNRGGFRLETFKAALRAYVAAQQLEMAEETMNALEKTKEASNITQIYIGLGRQIENSLKRIRAEGNQAEAAKVARGFELFLTRIYARPTEETTFNSLHWVAETFMSLGASMDTKGENLSPVAANYYKKAASVYLKIIELCRTDKTFEPSPGLVDGIQIRLAICLRRLGRYKEALDTLVEILKVRNTLIDAQLEAAYTYQAWGKLKPGYFLLAIRGGRKAKKKDGNVAYLVWGWGGIAKKLQYSKPHQDIFHEARYNLALCRMKYAMSKSGQKKVELMRQAEQDIFVVQRLRPEMGGKKWYQQYDALLIKIQRFLGVKANQQGLRAAERKLSSVPK